MSQPISLDLGQIARDLNLAADKVERTVALLDEGNTVPFITRYRKDFTGGLDEEQIRAIQFLANKSQQLLERKQTILKTIESQGKLTPELAQQIQRANSPKWLEDLYLPYKPKKQSLAAAARQRGLEPLAIEILEANPLATDLTARAQVFVTAENGIPSATEALQGVGHIIAEHYADDPELRGRLRRIFHRTGRIVCTKIDPPPEAAAPKTEPHQGVEIAPVMEQVAVAEGAESVSPVVAESVVEEAPLLALRASEEAVSEERASEAVAAEAAAPADPELPAGRLFVAPVASVALPAPEVKKAKKKKKKKVVGEHAFKDYYDYQEPLHKVPPHRVLAINRGERARAIRVKIEADGEAMLREAEQVLIPPDQPHAAFLRDCLRDALQRLIVPSLEREIRREQTELAEEHAVEVFVRNLRKLLLQQPVRNRRILAVDPGFKSGCKLVALDEFGNLLGHGVIYVIGKDDRREKARRRLAEFAKQHQITVIAIGNGTGCREAEQLVADALANELSGHDVAYVVVNEAGASIYSTSPLGREELPQCDALQRGAVSIGRRLLDPLSEMVKINPANLGVGLYQHDVKAKHLQDSLDNVVESCVNFVGVDVNSASPALLRYVSGMNALTARRVYEYRRVHGPFKNRDELKNVQGFGDATFVQSAGFLKIIGGENPLDATWIHPESYEIAQKLLAKLGTDVAELAKAVPIPRKAPAKKVFAAALSPDPVAETPLSPPAADEPVAVVAEAVVPSLPESVEPEAAVETPAVETVPVETAVVDVAPQMLAESAAVAVEPLPVETPAAEPAMVEPPPRNLIAERAAEVNIVPLAQELQVGEHLLRDMLATLTRPGLDPRDNLPPPIFRRGIMKLEDLQAGMELQGTVLNVVDFGAFVDIGLTDSGLVHISRLADRFIKDPHEVVGVGDVLKVWVVEVDKSRRRVSLTAIAPGAERPQRPSREEQRPPRQPRQPNQQRAEGQQRPPRPAQNAAASGTGGPPAPHQGQQRPPRPQGGGGQGEGGRRDQGRGRPQQPQQPKTVERPSTKPKVVKPITKAQEEGKAPMRSFSDLLQLFDKKKTPKTKPGASEEPETSS